MVGQQADAMSNPEHLAKLKEGATVKKLSKVWNRWRQDNPQISPVLLGADLSQTFLFGANLSEANLSKANLSSANLTHANLIGANLSGADLRGAFLHIADLSGANLRGADLSEAYFVQTVFNGADLSGSNLDHAHFRDTILADNDLSTVKGLETVRHRGRSTIGIDTVFRSKGNVPEPFLRGCGVPDEFITYMKSLTANPIQFYSCFISYSTKDQAFADRLYADLQNKGVRCWFAPHDVQGGRKLHEQIDEAIRLHDKLLLVLSGESMSSKWVRREILEARRRELKENRRVLFPIRLVTYEVLQNWKIFHAGLVEDLADEIREYFIPDFSNWKNHDSYQEAFQRLLSDLKASDSKLK